MRILHYHRGVDLTQGGVARAVVDMTGVLARAGMDVTLATPRIHDPAGVVAAQGSARAAVAELPALGRSQRLGPGALSRLDELIRATDVVHLHALWSPSNLQVARLARRAGKAYVVTVHGMLGGWSLSQARLKKQVFLALGGRSYLRWAAALHFSCEDEREQARGQIGSTPTRVIPLALDLDPFRGGGGAARDSGARPRVLFLSRLHPVKGVELLIEAVERLAASGLEPELVIAGTGDEAYERTMRERARPLGDRATFPGFVDGSAKADLYRSADVFVLPSEHENFGLAWAEAMACGVATIVTRQTGPAREIEAAGAGVVTDRTPGAITEALVRLLTDAPGRAALGERGRAWVLEVLDPGRIAGEFAELYRGAAGKPG